MKYIFRYTLLSNFPHPDNKITSQQLQEALKSVNFQFEKYNLNLLQELSLRCVQKILLKPLEKVITIIEETFFSEQNQKIPNLNAKQLQTIWQQQKVNIYKSILKSSCSSSHIYKDLQWSVKNIIMCRGQSLNRGNSLLTRLDINCFQNPHQPEQKISLIISMNKKGVERMFNSLVECQNAVNQILLCQE